MTKVVVVDRGNIGEGSTGRCAGGVRQQFSTEVNVRVGMRSVEILRNFETLLGAPSDFYQIGYLFVASDDAAMADLRHNLEVQHHAGLEDSREVAIDEIARMVPGLPVDDLLAATFSPPDGLPPPTQI